MNDVDRGLREKHSQPSVVSKLHRVRFPADRKDQNWQQRSHCQNAKSWSAQIAQDLFLGLQMRLQCRPEPHLAIRREAVDRRQQHVQAKPGYAPERHAQQKKDARQNRERQYVLKRPDERWLQQ